MGAPHDVYYNLTRRVFSVRCRSSGLVTHHTCGVYMEDVAFVVQPAGHAKAAASGVRNVHAFARGTVKGVGWPSLAHGERLISDDALARIGYNPFKGAAFKRRDTGANVQRARVAYLVSHNGGGHILIPTW